MAGNPPFELRQGRLRVKMVILRSSGGVVGVEPVAATPKRRTMELDTSSEFLSLLPASQRKSTRLTRSSRVLDDSFSSPENNTTNVRIYTNTSAYVTYDVRLQFIKCVIKATLLC